MGQRLDIDCDIDGATAFFRPLTPRAQAWIERNLGEDPPVFQGAVLCESRHAFDVIAGARADGLTAA